MTSRHSFAVAVAVLLALVTTGCRVDVLHRLPETEANRVVATLQQHGIAADKTLDDPETGTWAVSVAQGSASRAWAILDEYKMPRTAKRGFEEVFGGSSLVVTPVEEKAMYLEALQGEIARTLESVQGVIDARVHVVLPERDLTGQIVGRPKASVVVEYQASGGGLLPMQNSEIQSIVSHAVDGLTADTVAVVQKPASITAPSASGAGNFKLVSLGPLVMEESSLGTFKVVLGLVVLVIGVLAMLIFWQGRAVAALRDELLESRQKVQSLQRSTGRAA